MVNTVRRIRESGFEGDKMTFEDFKLAVEAHGWRAIDRKNFHWQIRQSAINPVVVSWYPRSANKTCFASEIHRRETDCDLNRVLKIAAEVFATQPAVAPER